MTTDRNERVMEMVEEAIRENPDVSNEELQERASEIDPRIGELSSRSFNARYPLQVKRKLAAEQETESSETDADEEQEGVARSDVRQALLDFARDVAGAEDRVKAMDVVLNVDDYVDQAMTVT